MRKVDEQPEERTAADASSHSPTRVEINFDGLRSAITPISLMFDGRLFKDLKGLIGHVTHATKKVSAERPDYQGALREIDQLDVTFRAALNQWEKKLTGEIQRLKTAIETEPDRSLGATKQINRFQAELNRGRASTRSMPSKTSQVRNQLIAASGRGPISQAAAVTSTELQLRFSRLKRTFPIIYSNSAQQILRRAQKRNDDKNFCELALSIFTNVSKPVHGLGAEQIYQGVLYYLHETAAGDDVTDDLTRQKAQFVVVIDINKSANAYVFQSPFLVNEQTFEIPFADFEERSVDVLEPLGDVEVIIKLLKAKFRDEELKTTFHRYHLIRKKALDDKRDEKFNPRQLAIHQYLTGLVFDFVGINYDNPADEIRFVGEINNTLQRVK